MIAGRAIAALAGFRSSKGSTIGGECERQGHGEGLSGAGDHRSGGAGRARAGRAHARGRGDRVRPLAPDVVEVRISLAKPVDYLPGQYYRFRFQGYPTRCFSPTLPMQGPSDERSVRLHVRRVRDGLVSPALGVQIRQRASRQASRDRSGRLSQAQQLRPPCAGRERHRIRADLDDPERGDQRKSGARDRRPDRRQDPPLALYADRPCAGFSTSRTSP